MGHVLTRHDDWQTRLQAYLARARKRRFAWGRHDCAWFSFGAVEAMTGVDLMREYRGAYTTPLGARRALLQRGHPSLPDAVTAALGEPVAALKAAEGDIVETAGPALGICTGLHAAVLTPSQGFLMVPPAAWARCWRV